MKFSPAELEAMRLADEEIDREFEEKYVADQVDKEIDKWLDELAIADMLDHKHFRRRKASAAYYAEHKDEIAAYQAAYRAEHKDEIAAYQAAYYAEHKDEIAAYQAAYYAEHKKNQRRQHVLVDNVLYAQRGDVKCTPTTASAPTAG